eukprot:187813_1
MSSITKTQCVELQKCNIFTRLKTKLQQIENNKIDHEKWNVLELLNDFFHLLEFHDANEYDSIYEIFGGACDSTQCQILQRQYAVKTTDKSIRTQTVDKIHCYYRHSFDMGLRLRLSTSEEKSNNTQQTEDTAQWGLVNNKLLEMRQIFSKKQSLQKRLGLFDRFSNKYNQIDSLKVPSNNNKMYCYGKEFLYEGHEEKVVTYKGEDVMDIKPKYSTLKEELISNEIKPISVDQFEAEYNKAEIYLNSEYRKKYYSNITKQHLLALMIYCNFDALQNKFSKTYRENIETHTSFGHLGQLLKTLCRKFGTAVGGYHNKSHIHAFYHGIGERVLFPKIINDVQIFCPLSTTSSLQVAMNFTNNQRGLILQFGAPPMSQCKYFSVSWLSDYANESEYLFVQCQYPLRIDNIMDITYGYEYNMILKALKITDDVLTGYDIEVSVSLSSLVIAMINHQLSCTLPQQFKPFNHLSEYAKQLINVYCENKTYVRINCINTHFSSMFKAVMHSEYQWIKLDLLNIIFPNMVSIDICNINGCLSIFNDLLYHLSKNKHNLKTIEILTNKTSDFNIASCKNQYDGRFDKLGFNLVLKPPSVISIKSKQPKEQVNNNNKHDDNDDEKTTVPKEERKEQRKIVKKTGTKKEYKVDIGSRPMHYHFIHMDCLNWKLTENKNVFVQFECANYPAALSMNFFFKPPNIEKPSNIEKIRNSARKMLSEGGLRGGIIKCETLAINGIDTVEQLLKLSGPLGVRGIQYIWSITIPFKDRSYVIKVNTWEKGGGLREAVVAMQTGQSGMDGWQTDPYDPTFKLGNRMNKSEDEKYDQMFPLNPLSVLRMQIIPKIKQSIRFDDDVKKLKPL